MGKLNIFQQSRTRRTRTPILQKRELETEDPGVQHQLQGESESWKRPEPRLKLCGSLKALSPCFRRAPWIVENYVSESKFRNYLSETQTRELQSIEEVLNFSSSSSNGCASMLSRDSSATPRSPRNRSLGSLASCVDGQASMHMENIWMAE